MNSLSQSYSRQRLPRIKKISGRKVKRDIFYVLITWVCLAVIIAILARPERYTAACAEAVALWAQCVLPALFPFMVVCSLLIASGAAEKISRPFGWLCKKAKLPSCAPICILLGLLSGYPAGARNIALFFEYRKTDSRGAEKLAFICTACGPVFLAGTVGAGMFASAAIGAKLIAAHLAAVLFTGVILALIGKKSQPTSREICAVQMNNANILEECFFGSVKSALTAGAFIAFFYTLSAMAEDYCLLMPAEKIFMLFTDEATAHAAARGLIEMTGGCAALAKAGSPFSVPLAGFLVTSGGLCVLFQQLSYLTKAGVNSLKFVAVKIVQGVLCFAILLAIC